jgi:hypothetical protein
VNIVIQIHINITIKINVLLLLLRTFRWWYAVVLCGIVVVVKYVWWCWWMGENSVLYISFIHQRLYSPLLGPGPSFSFAIFFTQTVGLLGRVISPSQGRYLHTGQLKHIINAHTDIHALTGIRSYDPSVRASEDSACLRRRGNCDRHTPKWCADNDRSTCPYFEELLKFATE